MILQLKYSDEIQHETRAAFIRSTEPQVWLEQIELWGINPLTLNCFGIPVSKKTLEIAGLFVVFSLGNVPEQMGQALAYGSITSNFFVPINAKLFPQISQEELNHILLFDTQIFHPSIGMVGFNETDKIDLEDLLVLPKASQEQWNIAAPAPAPFPPLQRIQIPKLLDEDFLKTLKEGLETKPLKDIPDARKDGKGETWLDKMQREALKKLLAEDKTGRITSGRSGGSFRGTGGFGILGGLFGKLGSVAPSGGGLIEWAERKLAELERKRQDEIDRLMNLFETNPEEALKYALPLDGNYLGRGEAAPSGRLGRHNTNFSLGGLGGGRRVDGWDLGNRYYELRRKYYEEAKRLLEAKKYRKAAYIYAHLLSDFSSAANALEQGKYYREAAVLYQEHLNNVPRAAACLEKGGLFLEAIDLYIDLGENEKVGDLYQQLEQTEQARKFYQKCITSAQKNDDYLEVARLQNNKLFEANLARQTLLEGWQNSKQSENCLKKYFDWLQGENLDVVQEKIELIYAKHTPAYRKNSFLNVLLHIKDRYREEAVLDTARPIAYEIISEQIVQNKVGNVHYLRQFLPDDRLIGSDCSRYVTQFHAAKKKKKTNPSLRTYQLDKNINWKTLLTRNRQFLALGTTEGRLILVRGHFDGHLNYYSWELHLSDLDAVQFNLISSLETNIIFIHASVPIFLKEKKLAKSVRFTEDLYIRGLDNLPSDIVENKKELMALRLNKGDFKLHFYDLKLQLKNVYDSRLEVVRPFSKEPFLTFHPTCRIAIHGKYLYIISADERLEQKIYLNAKARRLCDNESTVLVSTNKGMLLVQYVNSKLEIVSDFFATECSPIDIKFMTAQSFAIAEKNSLKIYDISTEKGTPILRNTIPVNNNIISIECFAKRNQLAVLTGHGKIEVFGLF